MTDKPPVLPVDTAGIPDSLKQTPRWVLWRHDWKGDRWSKVPYQTNGRQAKSNDPTTWSSYGDVEFAYTVDGGYDGIGLMLGDELHGIDVDDCRDPDTGELNELAQQILGAVDGYGEVSPSGTGIKIFSRTNLGRARKKEGLELYCGERYFTVTGSVLNAHNELPAELQDIDWLVAQEFGASNQAQPTGLDDDAMALLTLQAKSEMTPEQCLQALIDAGANPSSHSSYMPVLLAMHHQTDGSEHGWQLCLDWLNTRAHSGDDVKPEKWRAIWDAARDQTSVPVELSKLQRIQQAELAKKQGDVEAYRKSITDCLDVDKLRGEALLACSGLDVVRAWIKQYHALTGVWIPERDVRGWLGLPTDDYDLPNPGGIPLFRQWIKVSNGDTFFNITTKAEVTRRGFRDLFDRQMPMTRGGRRRDAAEVALNDGGMEVVDDLLYMPPHGNVFMMGHRRYANLYRDDSAPPMPMPMTTADWDAVEVVKHHFEVLVPDERTRELLLSWIAFCVQNPGVKIRWGVYLHGVEGVGKTTLLELMALAMGESNVSVVNGDSLQSAFNDWAAGHAVICVEEMRQSGINRHQTMNRIKPLLTNDMIDLQRKFKNKVTVPNTSNYLLTSNFLDGAPISEGDRRYMFISSPVTTAQMRQLQADGHYERLYAAMRTRPGAMRYWLMHYQMHPEFSANNRAPDTATKAIVIELSKSDAEVAAEGLIESGCTGVCREVVSSAHLTRALGNMGIPINTRTVNAVLQKLGYSLFGRVKWRNESCRVWAPAGAKYSNEEIRGVLDTTETGEFLQSDGD